MSHGFFAQEVGPDEIPLVAGLPSRQTAPDPALARAGVRRPALERLSIELTNRCGKGCSFCYNASDRFGETEWTAPEVTAFVEDCAANGVRAVSFGGGEPLEFPGVYEVLTRLRGALFRSLTTNGLLLDGPVLERLVRAAPDKVHVSIHFPDRWREVVRVREQVHALEQAGIRSGINLLVSAPNLSAAAQAAAWLRQSGIHNDRIVYLPMRGTDVPRPSDVARVAGAKSFQSTTCLAECARSPRFASISWDKRIAHCSYTPSRRRLPSLTMAAVLEALTDLALTHCGDERHERLIRLSRGPQHGHDVVRR